MNNSLQVSCSVLEQVESLRSNGLLVKLGIVSNRSSLRGIYHSIKQLEAERAFWEADIIHAQYGSVIALIGSQIQNRRTPLIISFCGSDLFGVALSSLKGHIHTTITRSIGLFSARNAAAIIVKSKNLYNALPVYLQQKTSIIPNGVNIDYFTPLDKKECRDKLDWKQNAPYVLFNSSNNDSRHIKNYQLAARACQLMQIRYPNLELIPISNVSRKNVLLMMNGADCLLVTSFHEGSPNIVKEAMACNLPIVSVPCGDVAERLQKVRPGGVYSYMPESLAAGVIDVIKTARRSTGREEIFSQKITMVDTASNLISLYESVLH